MKLMVDKICELYGDQIAIVDGVAYHDFPRIEALADTEVRTVLEAAKFGYRAKFIQQAAKKVTELGGSCWIDQLCKLPYKEAKAKLIQLPGVGAKVNIINFEVRRESGV
jgi:N-glycosylase/DNA lyase